MSWGFFGFFSTMGFEALYVLAAYVVCAALGSLELGLLLLRKRNILEHLGRWQPHPSNRP